MTLGNHETGFDCGFRPDISIADGDVVEDGTWRLQAVSTPGHASNHIAYALLGTGILFSGDHVMGWSTTVVSPPDGSMNDYISTLEKLIARADRIFLPGHGAPIESPQDFVKALLSHRLEREQMILERLRSGDMTAAEIASNIYKTTPVTLMPAAKRTVWAHLERLVEIGTVESDDRRSVVSRYRPKHL